MRSELKLIIRNTLVVLVAFVPIFSFAKNVNQETIEIVYPVSEAKVDQRSAYFISVIELAMKKSKTSYKLVKNIVPMTHARKLIAVNKGDIDFVWNGATSSLDNKLDRIKIPIYGGMNGYRVFITHQDNIESFSKIDSFDQLKSLVFGSGIGWAGTTILENASLNVDQAKYESLFHMASKKRIDLYHRGIQEAFIEIAERKAKLPNLAVVNNIGIYYDNPVYFYVSKKNKALSVALKSGLELAFKDGSFNTFFINNPFIKSALTQAKINDRHWFKVGNPLLKADDLVRNSKYYSKLSLPRVVAY